MSRIYTNKDEEKKPSIKLEEVMRFFEQRAKKANILGYKQAVIYQDKNPKLAEERDKAEKELLIPKFKLLGKERILDIGCGTGRWAEVLKDKVAYYHGVDASQGLIEIAINNFNQSNTKFSCLKAEDISLKSINEKELFDRVINIGVLMYLNEPQLKQYLMVIPKLISKNGIFIVREPVAIEKRLTLDMHYSDDMEQSYSAIYRTEEELFKIIEDTLYRAGMKLVESDNIFRNLNLNNRVETKQKYYIFKFNIK